MTYLPHLKKISSWLFNGECAVCGLASRRTLDLCEYCENRLPRIAHSCHCCGQQLSSDNTLTICGNCLVKPKKYDRLYSLFQYSEPINHLITAIKFSSQLHYARLLGTLFIHKITSDWYENQPLPNCIIPVPLHPTRLQERGFNQSLEIARPISKGLKIPLLSHACYRIKATKAQSELPAKKRYDNVKNAFSIKNVLEKKHIAILDDVVTTSHTVNELSHILKLNGAEKIDIWCCGRTPHIVE